MIAVVVALGVVEHLELVEVDEQQRVPGAARIGRGEHLAQSIAERRPVGEAGQRVAVGEIEDAFFRFLERSNVGHVAVPQDRTIRLALGNRLPEDPLVGPVGHHQTVPALAGRVRRRGSSKAGQDLDHIVRVDHCLQQAGVLFDIVRAQPGDGLDRSARKRDRIGPVGRKAVLIEETWNELRDLFESLLLLLAVDGVGHLAHEPFVVAGLAGALVPDQARAFLDPDALARLVAIDLGNDVADFTVGDQRLVQFGAPVRVDVPLTGDVVDRAEHLRLAGEAVETDEGRVGTEHVSVEGGAEDALADAVVEILKTAVGGAQGDELGVAFERECAERKADQHQSERRGGHDHRVGFEKAHGEERVRTKPEEDDLLGREQERTAEHLSADLNQIGWMCRAA